MEKHVIDKKEILKSIIKMVKDKETVSAYLKGKVSGEMINKKGIKLAKPV